MSIHMLLTLSLKYVILFLVKEGERIDNYFFKAPSVSYR